jgi:hypothetical protein
MSPIGPTRTSRGVRAYVACWVKADVAEGQERQAATLVRLRNGSGLHLRDRDEQKLAYLYFDEEPGRRSAAKLLTRDEAWRIAANIAKFTGAAGGPMAQLAPLIGKNVGVKKVPISYRIEGKKRSAEIPNILHMSVDPLPTAHPSEEIWANTGHPVSPDKLAFAGGAPK